MNLIIALLVVFCIFMLIGMFKAFQWVRFPIGTDLLKYLIGSAVGFGLFYVLIFFVVSYGASSKWNYDPLDMYEEETYENVKTCPEEEKCSNCFTCTDENELKEYSGWCRKCATIELNDD